VAETFSSRTAGLALARLSLSPRLKGLRPLENGELLLVAGPLHIVQKAVQFTMTSR